MSVHKNILFLIADDWSPIARCYGDDVVRMPNVDAAAERGVIFDHAFCTTPSCAASRATILTGLHSHTHGQYGHSHGVHNFRTLGQTRSVPAVLREHGYATGLIGKSHVAPEKVYPFEFTPKANPWHVVELAEAAKTFFDETKDRPFYLHVGFVDPHRDFGVGRTFPGTPDEVYDPTTVPVPPWLPDHPDVRRDLADYYRAISRLDHGIGLTLKALEESGRADDTLVIITSDHGMPFPGCKASSFDSGHRCPLIVLNPAQKKRGIHNNALVNWTDYAPTFYEWAGVEAPEGLHGQSILTILEEENPVGRDETYFSHTFHEVINYHPYRVIRTRKYKYVRNLAWQLPHPLPTDLYRSPTWQAVLKDRLDLGVRPLGRFVQKDSEELFDLENDPHESENLIDDPTLQDVAQEMREKVMAFRVATNDPWLENSFQWGEAGTGQKL